MQLSCSSCCEAYVYCIAASNSHTGRTAVYLAVLCSHLSAVAYVIVHGYTCSYRRTQ